jgi:hypothetical protein
MPRVSDVYSVPAGTLPVVPDTTIESAKYNSLMNDIAADLNIARPIVAGGTSATTAAAALTNLGGVVKAGDTMTGNLTITTANAPSLVVNSTGTGVPGRAYLTFQQSGQTRFDMFVGGASEGGNFTIERFNPAGTFASNAMFIEGGTGNVTFNGQVYSVWGGANQGIIRFGSDNVHYLWFDGTKYSMPSGELFVNSTQVARNGQIPDFYSINIKATGGDPQLTFFKDGVLQSYLKDNGAGIHVFSNSAGTTGMYILHGASAWSALSDARLPYKKTARQLSVLDRLEHVQLYENKVEGRLELFGKAQELVEAFPHVVKRGDDDSGYIPTGPSDERAWGVSYDRLGIVALQAVKELLVKVEKLEERIKTLEEAKQ